jgi:preprotein translocase subunit SecE
MQTRLGGFENGSRKNCSMNAKVEDTSPVSAIAPVDYAILTAGLIIIGAGIFAFYHFNPAWQSWVRVLTVVGGCLAGAAVMSFSHPGKSFLKFLNASMLELRKVVWPTKQETTQTTMVVIVAVIIVGILLFIMDFILAELVKYAMGG